MTLKMPQPRTMNLLKRLITKCQLTHLMVRLTKTAGMERRKPKKAPRALPQSTSILENSGTFKYKDQGLIRVNRLTDRS